MIPLLTYPLALIALVSLPALAAIYFLRNRFRRHTVSSLMLWRFAGSIKGGGPKLDRIQFPFIFFLELAILTLLVCAATGPRWQLPSTIRPLVVILDNSRSMLAGTPGDTPRQLGEHALRSLLEHRRFASIRFVLAGQEPRLTAANHAARSALDDLPANWSCHAPSAALDEALQMATDLGLTEASILVITDHPPEDRAFDGHPVCWWAFGHDLPNLGFVTARRSIYGNQDRCLVEIANYASQPQETGLEIMIGTNRLQHAPLKVPPGESRRIAFNVPAEIGVVEASIKADAFLDDNRVLLAAPERKKVRTLVSIEDESLRRLVNRALEATGLSAPPEPAPDLIIHQDPKPVNLPSAWDLRFLTGTPAEVFTGPFLVDNTHELGQGISLDGVIWAVPNTHPLPGVPIIAAGNQILLAAGHDVFGRQHLTLRLSPDQSTLPGTLNWPALFWNLLDWRLRAAPGLRESNARLGAEVEFVSSEPQAVLFAPNQSQTTIPLRTSPALLRPDQLGLHAVATTQRTNWLAVNLLSPEESNLQKCSSGRWGQWQAGGVVRTEYQSVLWIFLLAALGCLALHLACLARSRTAL